MDHAFAQKTCTRWSLRSLPTWYSPVLQVYGPSQEVESVAELFCELCNSQMARTVSSSPGVWTALWTCVLPAPWNPSQRDGRTVSNQGIIVVWEKGMRWWWEGNCLICVHLRAKTKLKSTFPEGELTVLLTALLPVLASSILLLWNLFMHVCSGVTSFGSSSASERWLKRTALTGAS